MEREVKLALPSRDDWEAVCRLGSPCGELFQDNRFFDTEDLRLRTRGWALRLRRQWPGRSASGAPKSCLLTLKGPARRVGSSFHRQEFEQQLSLEQVWALLEGASSLDRVVPHSWPLSDSVRSLSLGDMHLLVSFQNLRVCRRIALLDRTWTLEVDATFFPGGHRAWEVELEYPDFEEGPTLERALRQMLLDAGIRILGPGRGKFSRALRFAEEMPMVNVPKFGCVLTFEPLAKATVWGGHRLAERYGKPSPPRGEPCGETWEVVDLPEAQSIVRQGPLKGTSLGQLRDQETDWLMGRAGLLWGRFPLLLKLIDAQETLSVQVHPDEEVAQRLASRPKTECWVVLDAEPGSCLYLGLKPGVTKAQLAEACSGPSLEHLLNRVEVRPLDVIFIPAGTVHAIGAGLVLAELQQSSDTTYRLHDWGRVGLDGKPRKLHLAEALESIHFEVSDPPPWTPRQGPGRVVDSHAFVMDLLALDAGQTEERDHREPLVLLCLQGGLTVQAGEDSMHLGPGQAALVPAASARTRLSADQDDTWALVAWPK